jgi:hypothetical protein
MRLPIRITLSLRSAKGRHRLISYAGLFGLAFASTASANPVMWTAATFASHGVRGFNDPGDISDQSMSDLAATGAKRS